MWAMATDSSEWSHGKVCASRKVQAKVPILEYLIEPPQFLYVFILCVKKMALFFTCFDYM